MQWRSSFLVLITATYVVMLYYPISLKSEAEECLKKIFCAPVQTVQPIAVGCVEGFGIVQLPVDSWPFPTDI